MSRMVPEESYEIRILVFSMNAFFPLALEGKVPGEPAEGTLYIVNLGSG